MAFEHGQIVTTDGDIVIAAATRPRGYFARLRGLIGRAELTDHEAWWFCDCASVHTMGMRRAIDVVHLDARGCVLRVKTRLPPLSMSAARRGRHVIELSAGAAARAGIDVGQALRFVS